MEITDKDRLHFIKKHFINISYNNFSEEWIVNNALNVSIQDKVYGEGKTPEEAIDSAIIAMKEKANDET